VEFAAVRDRLISKLDAEEQNKILATLRMEARERRPDGLVLNMEALEDLVLSAESVVGELN
jgi:anti-anti-sigma regulatory factor